MEPTIRTLQMTYEPPADWHDGHVHLLEQSTTRFAIALVHGDIERAKKQADVHFERLATVRAGDRKERGRSQFQAASEKTLAQDAPGCTIPPPADTRDPTKIQKR